MLLFIFWEKDNRLINLHKLIKQKRENKSFLKNVINVLLTRGVHGLYIYAVDTDLRQKLVSLKQDRL